MSNHVPVPDPAPVGPDPYRGELDTPANGWQLGTGIHAGDGRKKRPGHNE